MLLVGLIGGMSNDGSMTMALEGENRVTRAYAEHAPEATRLAYFLVGDPQTAEDLVQDAFVRILGRWGSLRKPDAFRAYLCRTVVNLSKKHFRRKGLERAFLQRERRTGSSELQAMPDVAVKDELWRALQSLPHRQRAAVVLRYYADLSEQQAADAMGCSVGAINSLVARGLTGLRRQIRVSEGDES